METYIVDLAKYLSSNEDCKLNVYNRKNGVYSSNKLSLWKDYAGRMYCNYEKPVQLNIDGHKIPNISSYSVIDYKDAATSNGKYFDIRTIKSNIALYTHNNKFAMMREYFKKPQTLDINGKKIYGYVTRTLFKDGAQKYEVVTPNYNIKVINLDAFGKEIMPEQTYLKVINKMFKQTRKLLKFLF